MRSDLFRQRLIKSLTNMGFGAVYVPKINSDIEALVEQHLLLRQVRLGEHEIGLNKIIWNLSSETIGLIYDATTIATKSLISESDFSQLVHEVKKQLRKLGSTRTRVRSTALEILIARFLQVPSGKLKGP